MAPWTVRTEAPAWPRPFPYREPRTAKGVP